MPVTKNGEVTAHTLPVASFRTQPITVGATYVSNEGSQQIEFDAALGKEYFNEDLINTAWPQVDTKNLKDPTYELVIQINGKKRHTRQTDIGLEQSEVEEICKVEFNMNLSDYKKIIYIPDKIINFVG